MDARLTWETLQVEDKLDWMDQEPTRVLLSELSRRIYTESEQGWSKIRTGNVDQIHYVAGFRDALLWVRDKFFKEVQSGEED